VYDTLAKEGARKNPSCRFLRRSLATSFLLALVGCSHGFCANSRWLARGTFSPISVAAAAADDVVVVVVVVVVVGVDENSIIIVH
jgi:hypothetical protein